MADNTLRRGVVLHIEGDPLLVERVQMLLELADALFDLRSSQFGDIAPDGTLRLAWWSGDVDPAAIRRFKRGRPVKIVPNDNIQY